MSWKKHFKKHNISPLTNTSDGVTGKYSNYASKLPDVYVGYPSRLNRYSQYENMDIDSEINSALDILAEFCTQSNTENGTAFDIVFHETPSDSELDSLKKELIRWNNVNKFEKRIFKIFRNTIKYGDQVFIRDPETMEWYWVEMLNVSKVIVNESEGKEPEQYIVKDINPNFQSLSVSTHSHTDSYPSTGSPTDGTMQNTGMYTNTGASSLGRFELGVNESSIDASNIIHCSLSEGLDTNWPFGNSILESVYKIFKQKELIEDAIIIYRIQRAPERRIFKIDTGDMPSNMAMAFVERVKNEVYQRRIPSHTGGGDNISDTTYNPISTNEDFFFPHSADGRGSSVETLPGGQNLGDIDDLKYFTNKLYRGLRIPSSYLPTGFQDESPAGYNDGRVGTALIQENRFNEYCKRLQRLVVESFDREFKIFLAKRGFTLDNSSFNLKFNEPQNFSTYREAELDSARINTFTSLEQYAYFSKRFLMDRFLGLSEEEVAKNQQMWAEEQGIDIETSTPNMRTVGISPGGIDSDLDSFDDISMDSDDIDLDLDLGDEGTSLPEME